MNKEKEVLDKLKKWAEKNHNVRSVILTSSRVIPNSELDIFSDYDVELFVSDIKPFLNDDWLEFWGSVMIRWPLRPVLENGNITRLVHFQDKSRIDFQINSGQTIKSSTYDSGFRILIDKDGIATDLEKPTYQKYIVKKPTQEEFITLINDFFWDATYVPKSLRRDELYFTKYILDNVMRFEYLEKMIEWHIATKNNWNVSTKVHGRTFKKQLTPVLWNELEKTFSGADIEENWAAFFNTIKFFRKISKSVANDLGYDYPKEIDLQITNYCEEAKILKLN